MQQIKRGKISLLIIGLSLLAALLLAACSKPTEKELIDLYQSNIIIKEYHRGEVGSDEEFLVQFNIKNNLEFPISIDSIEFPFSDFMFFDERNERFFVIYPKIEVKFNEIEILEYKVKRNMAANLGSGIISSSIRFNLNIADPKYGSMDLVRNTDFVLEFI